MVGSSRRRTASARFLTMFRTAFPWTSTWVLLLILLLPGTGGCVSATALAPDVKARTASKSARLVLMHPDLITYEQTTGGLLEPRAQWTLDAETHLVSALERALTRRGLSVVPSNSLTRASHKVPPFTELWKLQEAVARSILDYHYITALKLPTKSDALDWSLGSTTATLRAELNADFALFVYLRDSYLSPGRIALKVLAAGLYLNPFVLIPDSTQFGYGMLVDLHDGRVLWFHRYQSRTGDLREADDAQEVVEGLLSEFPL